jgi:putative ABC transport system permease protein
MLSFGFLFVCLVNAIGLMLAKFTSRAGELGVRRALGASRSHVFLQCLAEAAAIGVVGGAFGLVLALLGVAAERAILPGQWVRLAHMNLHLVGLTLALAVVATLCAGIYPAWRVSRIQPAWSLKEQ